MTEELGEWLDASKIKEFQLCPRRYYYRYEEHLVPKTTSAKGYANPMQYGVALHAALASYYDGSGLDESTCPCPGIECNFCKGQPIPRMAALFLLYYPFDPEIELDDNPRTADPRTRERGIEILHQYLERYGRETFEVLATEIPFAIEFHDQSDLPFCVCGHVKQGHEETHCLGIPGRESCDCVQFVPKTIFTYVGRIDLIKKEYDQIAPLDHKSTTQFGQRFHNQWVLDPGITGYMYAVSRILDVPIESGEINGIRITTKIQQDESFLRITTTRNPENFEEWEQEVRTAFQLIQQHRASGFWPKHAPYACSAYNRTCEFYGLCTATRSARANIIEEAFVKQEWNPTDVE